MVRLLQGRAVWSRANEDHDRQEIAGQLHRGLTSSMHTIKLLLTKSHAVITEMVRAEPNKAYFLVSRSLTTLQAATPLASKAPASVLPLNIGPCFDHLCSNMSDQQEGLLMVCTTGRLVFAAEHSVRKLYGDTKDS